ncbi:MAG: GNAT family N-acetyltransferase [Bacteroidetes bacterium MedPE-SWsnd-G2]|nr:MAG: GNAT family N-acetyltransferase [Bacteroidetes bacterium MedPE-SWsnd-G2]
MIEIKLVHQLPELNLVETLAKEIWTEHYTPIIGRAQVAYMLNKFQSVETMSNQIDEGYQYYAILHDDKMKGYFSIQKREHKLFLSKLYVLKSQRGLGLGKAAIQYITKQAPQLDCDCIALTVNRFNKKSIKAYEKMGFTNIGEVVMDIGEGYIMDDYILEKKIN